MVLIHELPAKAMLYRFHPGAADLTFQTGGDRRAACCGVRMTWPAGAMVRRSAGDQRGQVQPRVLPAPGWNPAFCCHQLIIYRDPISVEQRCRRDPACLFTRWPRFNSSTFFVAWAVVSRVRHEPFCWHSALRPFLEARFPASRRSRAGSCRR